MREAGRLALPNSDTQVKSWTKDKSSPVTEVDIAVDDLLRERLAGIAPDYGWLSEETADDQARLSARRVWIVDPIDGTRGFIAGFPDWSIVGGPGRGWPAGRGRVLFAPATEAMFTAAAASARTLNGRPIAATRGRSCRRAPAWPARRRYLARIAALAGASVPLPKIHSLALRLARVAMVRSTRPLPRRTATTGTLRQPIFWCTKPAAC